MNVRERQFADFYEQTTGFDLVAQPPSFQVQMDSGRSKYRPDFYCPNNDTFFEVVGTRQAWQQNREKISLFRKQWPTLKFLVVHSDGREYLGNSSRYYGSQGIQMESVMRKQAQPRKGYTIKLTEFERADLERGAAKKKMKPTEFLRQLIREATGGTIGGHKNASQTETQNTDIDSDPARADGTPGEGPG